MLRDEPLKFERMNAVEPESPSTGRTLAGGFLMGLANLVPGVSGGTMILALGLYDRFIHSIAEVTRLRPGRTTLLFLGVLAVGLAVAVFGMAGPAVWLVTEHRWVAYSLFIGMTLGGIPALWPALRPLEGSALASIVIGFTGMALLAFGMQGEALPQNAIVFLVAGALAASSMILPGVSGSYILLIFGLYDVVIGSVRPSALMEDWRGSLGIVVPVGIGAVLGIGLLSNVLKVLLTRHEKPAHGFLLGLLLGSVLGLWPFQEAVHPDLVGRKRVQSVLLLSEGESLEAIGAQTGVVLAPERAPELRRKYAGLSKGELKLRGLELGTYRPSIGQIVLSLGLFLAGCWVTRRLATPARPASDPAG